MINPTVTAFAAHRNTDWCLVTGQPGSGKTTAVARIARELTQHGVPIRGFYTEEVLDGSGSRRIGFDVVTYEGDGSSKRGVLARKGGSGPKRTKVGAYSVDVASFEQLALSSLADDDNPRVVYVLDEVGRMELKSERFAARVEELLGRGVKLIGAITAPIYGHRVEFCDRQV